MQDHPTAGGGAGSSGGKHPDFTFTGHAPEVEVEPAIKATQFKFIDPGSIPPRDGPEPDWWDGDDVIRIPPIRTELGRACELAESGKRVVPMDPATGKYLVTELEATTDLDIIRKWWIKDFLHLHPVAVAVAYVEQEEPQWWKAKANDRKADDRAQSQTSSSGTSSQSSSSQSSSSLGEWDAGDDEAEIEPRGWLLGNTFCRGFVSSLIGDGGIGKTSVRMAQVLSTVVERALTGEHVFMRCRVLIVSLEDDAKELRRRIRAACLHHKIDPRDLKGWLFLAAPGRKGGKILTVDNYGRPMIGRLAANIERVIQQRKIDIVTLDPFVKTHSIEENNNSMMDEVAQVLSDLAIEYNIAVDVPHHTSKGPADPGNANRGRGASSMKDAARLVYTLSPMTEEEAKAFNLSEQERRSLVRLDSAKVNIAPPSHEAKWFRLVGINIGNATGDYPNGDDVQTVEVWKPPSLFASISIKAVNDILDEIDAGLSDGSRYTDAPRADFRAAWMVVAKQCPGKAEADCRGIIAIWRKSGLLMLKSYDNPATRKPATGFWVDATKRP